MGMRGAGCPGEDNRELEGTGQGGADSPRGHGELAVPGRTGWGQHGTGQGGAGTPRGSRQQAGMPAARRQGATGAGGAGQGSAGCHGARVQAAATLGRGAGQEWEAGKVHGSRQGEGRVPPAPAGCRQPVPQVGCCQPGTGCQGPRAGCKGPRAGCRVPGATGRARAGCGVTLEEGGDVPGGDAPLLHKLPQGHLQEEDGDAAHEDDEQVGDEEDAWGRGEGGGGTGPAQPPPPPPGPPGPPLPSLRRPPGRSEWRRRLRALPSPRCRCRSGRAGDGGLPTDPHHGL